MTESLTRRDLLKTASAASAAGVLAGGATSVLSAPVSPEETGAIERVIENDRIKQSVCRWCYMRTPLPELAAAAKAIGLRSIELVGPNDFETLRQFGLTAAVLNTHSIEKGLNDPAHHEACLNAIRTSLEAAKGFGAPNVITFSGNRNGKSDEEGLENCTKALKQVVGEAEKLGVTIVMELLNSRVDHADYQADSTPFGVELVERVGSERFKLLYDIYHLQIMEGDVIRTIRDHHEAIGHYHTAGVPGRHELDENQELQYPAIVRAIIDTGYEGYLGQEFIPAGDDALRSLAHGVRVCDV